MREEIFYQGILALEAVAQNKTRQRKPDFLSDCTWRYLAMLPDIDDDLKGIKRLFEAKTHLALSQADARPTLCIFSAYNHRTRATDPRDYYYSILGAAKMTLKADYRPKKSVQDVCIDFVAASIKATRGTGFTLSFLDDAVGLREVDPCSGLDLPSWAPGYHLPMAGRVSGMDATVDATKGIHELCDPKDRDPEARGRSLFVVGAQIDRVYSVGEIPSLAVQQSGAMRAYLVDYASRRRTSDYCPKRIPLVSALYATLTRRSDGECGLRTLLSMLQHLQNRPVTYDDALDMLWQDVSERVVTSIEQDPLVGDMDMLYLDLLDEDETEVIEGTLIDALDTSQRFPTHGLFETVDGYIGLAPVSLAVDDILCIIDGFICLVILRERDGYYNFVGARFVLELMVGEVFDLLKTGKTGLEKIRDQIVTLK
ncbi:hypothetical protein BDW74DRAFT_172824 [Aspergillus multicolor]|uniref:uncharacterized protein n=1 Tax=Aspergillus multicolor TaxID=41759 RepID=UPI003CCCAA57